MATAQGGAIQQHKAHTHENQFLLVQLTPGTVTKDGPMVLGSRRATALMAKPAAPLKPQRAKGGIRGEICLSFVIACEKQHAASAVLLENPGKHFSRR